jgi:hypothetical protein
MNSHVYRLHLWPFFAWDKLSLEQRLRNAIMDRGLGWIDVRPVGHAPTYRHEGNPDRRVSSQATG